MDGWVCMGVWYGGEGVWRGRGVDGWMGRMSGGCLEGGELMGLYECEM